MWDLRVYNRRRFSPNHNLEHNCVYQNGIAYYTKHECPDCKNPWHWEGGTEVDLGCILGSLSILEHNYNYFVRVRAKSTFYYRKTGWIRLAGGIRLLMTQNANVILYDEQDRNCWNHWFTATGNTTSYNTTDFNLYEHRLHAICTAGKFNLFFHRK